MNLYLENVLLLALWTSLFCGGLCLGGLARRVVRGEAPPWLKQFYSFIGRVRTCHRAQNTRVNLNRSLRFLASF
jgi:hypothetical protein